jgi:iron(III) transport system substrate-binding protein
MKAAREGLALSYQSPEASSLPKWATWRDQIFATTYEPIVVVYNRRFLQEGNVPTTHRQLRELLVSQTDKYCGKVTTYAVRNDEVGAVPFEFDAKYDPQFWSLARAMGALDTRLEASSAAMIERVRTGQSLIAYNVAGADAIRRARRDPLIGVQFTLDYNLVLSRLMFISKAAQHPNAARLWVDFLLSKQGQQQMQVADLFPIRDDLENADQGIALLRRAPGVAKPLALDEGLASLANAKTTNDFRSRWKRATKNGEHRCGPGVGDRVRGRSTLTRMLPTQG